MVCVVLTAFATAINWLRLSCLQVLATLGCLQLLSMLSTPLNPPIPPVSLLTSPTTVRRHEPIAHQRPLRRDRTRSGQRLQDRGQHHQDDGGGDVGRAGDGRVGHHRGGVRHGGGQGAVRHQRDRQDAAQQGRAGALRHPPGRGADAGAV